MTFKQKTTIVLVAWLLVSTSLSVLGNTGMILWTIFAIVAFAAWFRINARPLSARDAAIYTAKCAKRMARRDALRRRGTEAKARRETAAELRSRTLELTYWGGHPDLPHSCPCDAVRTPDGTNVELVANLLTSRKLGKRGTVLLTVPAASVELVELMSQNKIITKTKSGAGRALFGGVVGGPVGAIVGGASGRRSNTHSVRDDVLRVTVATGTSRAQLLFKGPSGASANTVYAKASAVFAAPNSPSTPTAP